MRTPSDVPARVAKARSGHARWWIIGGVLVLILLLGSLRSFAGLYTDSLWFGQAGFHRVWSTILAVKLGLFASFGATFFVVLWVNLVICDRLAAHAPSLEPEDDVVRRYQRVIRPYAGRVYAVLALAVALIAAATTIGQWNNWLLFTHAQTFPHTDPQFGVNAGFYVFRLPFLQFLVAWAFGTLLVVSILTVVFHYLNGGIRLRSAPRVRPLVKVHLSVLLALIALVKAGGYELSRYALDLSTNGYVEGASYTDVHARLPALEVLFFVSLFAAAILLYNIRRQGWTLPVLAVGVWAFVALVIGVIYPAVLQAFHVNPAQSKLESKYIARNISATRYAYGLGQVKVSQFPDNTTLPTATVDANLTTLNDVRLWDPSNLVTLLDFQTKQNISNYYTFQTVQVDRYTTHGTIRPDLVGVRQINSSSLPSSSWVNEHLQYTHGEGLVLAEGNSATAKGNPEFAISDVPSKSARGFPKVSQPAIYFGVKQPGYVIVDTHEGELNGQRANGTDIEGHYAGSGGVPIGSFLTRAAFALRLGDLNILLSNLVNPQSKIMFVRDVKTMAEKAAPFLSFDSQPYPALVDGHVDWILNAYTTTDDYPYSQNADTQNLPTTSGLPESYNYVRNSVIVVVNAYSGKMTYYSMDNDPILAAYKSAFPHMFHSEVTMPVAIKQQLRYGNDMFAAQAAIFGRYHITQPQQFYSAGDAWLVSPTTGVGSPTQTLQVNIKTNQQGQVISATYQPMTPVYQVEALPGQTTQSFTISDVYVPAGSSSGGATFLRALLVGDSNPTQFGKLRVFETPPGKSKVGPIRADAEIQQTTTISSKITLLNKEGSHVVLGNILPVLVGSSVVYVRPLYVKSTALPQPQLKYVIAVLGQQVRMEPTLGATLNALLGTTLKSTGGLLTTTPNAPVVTSPPGGSASSSAVAQARALLAKAAADFTQAQNDLKADTLGGYQHEIAAAQTATQKAESLLEGASNTSGHTNGPLAPASGSTVPSAATTSSPSANAPSPPSSDSGQTASSASADSGSKSPTFKSAKTSTATTTKPNET